MSFKDRSERDDRQGKSPPQEPSAMGPDAGRFLSYEELGQALLSHRALADRTGSHFVFLRLAPASSVHSTAAQPDWTELVAEVARCRCRRSDVSGWYAPEKAEIGIILPDASLQGALRVVHDVEHEFRQKAQHRNDPIPDLVCEVFVYPSRGQASGVNWVANEPGDSRRA